MAIQERLKTVSVSLPLLRTLFRLQEPGIAVDKVLFSPKNKYFFYSSLKSYVVGTH